MQKKLLLFLLRGVIFVFVLKTIVFKEWTFYERESRKNRS